MIAIFYIGVIGVGLPHFLWWAIVGKLPAVTAALGSLLVPVIGIAGSMILLGDRPTELDLIGFTLVFVAATCVLLQPAFNQTQR